MREFTRSGCRSCCRWRGRWVGECRGWPQRFQAHCTASASCRRSASATGASCWCSCCRPQRGSPTNRTPSAPGLRGTERPTVFTAAGLYIIYPWGRFIGLIRGEIGEWDFMAELGDLIIQLCLCENIVPRRYCESVEMKYFSQWHLSFADWKIDNRLKENSNVWSVLQYPACVYLIRDLVKFERAHIL